MQRIALHRVTLVQESTLSVPSRLVQAPGDAAEILRSAIGQADREHFVALHMDTRNRVTGVHVVSVGSLNASVVHPREVFKASILANAAAVLVGHNHPSGDETPSQEDIAITHRLRQAGELLGIPVLDHIVLGATTFYSFKEHGTLP